MPTPKHKGRNTHPKDLIGLQNAQTLEVDISYFFLNRFTPGLVKEQGHLLCHGVWASSFESQDGAADYDDVQMG